MMGTTIGNTIKKTFLIYLFCLLWSHVLLADSTYKNCEPTNSQPDQCECDVISDDGPDGVAYPQCSSLSCDMFSKNHQPAECETPSRGVHCQLSHIELNPGCVLSEPRLESRLSSADFCKDAVRSINKLGVDSEHFGRLNWIYCTPSHSSHPPLGGYQLLGVIDPWS
jgi:hypothetical protein